MFTKRRCYRPRDRYCEVSFIGTYYDIAHILRKGEGTNASCYGPESIGILQKMNLKTEYSS